MTTERAPLQGYLWTHDPSTVAECEGRYWVFGTGDGILSLHSADRVSWKRGPRVFDELPAWHAERVPKNEGKLWAPDVLYHDGRYLLYYSVSSWGGRDSAIGLAENATLDPTSNAYRWKDLGPVVTTSEAESDHNAIDPTVMRDDDGTLWLAYGSYWTGIKLMEMDPATGLRIAPDAPVHSLAWNEQIEAACLFRHGDFYYLIVNWGHCCRGVDSTYEMRVGRSSGCTGPYLDRDGVDLMRRGGTLLLASSGPFIGPGHAGILKQGDRLLMSYHYYSGRHRGRSRLDILPMDWDDGWPRVTARTDEDLAPASDDETADEPPDERDGA